ncbi:MAG TPA: pilus assembly protein TadG-related protein, partial [Bacillota bacterium]|nr:pilus assembly protein TadG-related protein [Bacillota bacterium]
MRARLKALLTSQRGSVVTVVALAMVVLLGMTALVTDVGLIYLKKTRLKSAIDAAVLAGAQELPYNPETAVAVAKDYINRNGVVPDTVTVVVAPDNKSLSVTATQRVNLVFATVLGLASSQVNVHTAGVVGPIVKTTGVMPIAVPEQTFQFGREYELKT